MTIAAYGRFTEAGIRRIAAERAARLEAERMAALPKPVPAAEPEPEGTVVAFVSPMRALITRIAEDHGLTYADMIGKSRKRHIVAARYEAIWAVKDARPCMSLPKIGRLFGKDHKTILHALNKRGTI